MKTTTLAVCSASLSLLIPTVALAHVGSDYGAHHFAAGFRHPFTGVDHLLALFAVGFWSIQLGRSARWRLPLAFLAMMMFGAVLAAWHLALPFVEPVILSSLLLMGLAVLASLRLPVPAALLVVGTFAVFHGYAHIVDAPPGSIISYSTGLLCSSAILLVTAALLGKALIATPQRQWWLRTCGGAICLVGLLLAVAH